MPSKSSEILSLRAAETITSVKKVEFVPPFSNRLICDFLYSIRAASSYWESPISVLTDLMRAPNFINSSLCSIGF
jgi:hypothetical protein